MLGSLYRLSGCTVGIGRRTCTAQPLRPAKLRKVGDEKRAGARASPGRGKGRQPAAAVPSREKPDQTTAPPEHDFEDFTVKAGLK